MYRLSLKISCEYYMIYHLKHFNKQYWYVLLIVKKKMLYLIIYLYLFLIGFNYTLTWFKDQLSIEILYYDHRFLSLLFVGVAFLLICHETELTFGYQYIYSTIRYFVLKSKFNFVHVLFCYFYYNLFHICLFYWC
jgi:hypothetical protein